LCSGCRDNELGAEIRPLPFWDAIHKRQSHRTSDDTLVHQLDVSIHTACSRLAAPPTAGLVGVLRISFAFYLIGGFHTCAWLLLAAAHTLSPASCAPAVRLAALTASSYDDNPSYPVRLVISWASVTAAFYNNPLAAAPHGLRSLKPQKWDGSMANTHARAVPHPTRIMSASIHSCDAQTGSVVL
jgi:hypothetical protein